MRKTTGANFWNYCTQEGRERGSRKILTQRLIFPGKILTLIMAAIISRTKLDEENSFL
jgi:hypothetical protein